MKPTRKKTVAGFEVRFHLYCSSEMECSLRFLLLFLALAAASGLAQESSSVQESSPRTPQEATVSPEVTKAEAAIVIKDWKTAEPLLSAWLAQHPQDARALFDIGYVADAQGRNDEAVSFYKRAIAIEPKSFEAQVSLGLLLARAGKVKEAKPILSTATALDPGSAGAAGKAKAWRALAEIELFGTDGKSDASQASIDLLEALKMSAETASDTLLAARIAESAGNSSAAETAYRKALSHDPDSAAANAGLAHSLIVQKNYVEAENVLKQALKRDPGNPALTAQLAAVLVAQDKTEALPLLQKYHADHPEDESMARMLAEVLADDGEYSESDKLYQKILATHPNDPDVLAAHGQNLVREKRYSDALQTFEAATALDERNGEAWSGMAFAAFQTHQPKITIQALTMRSKYLPESATIYFLWATAYDTLHDKKQASTYYRRFLDSSDGKLPDQEWQARQRLKVLENAH